MRTLHHDEEDRQQYILDLDEIARQGARRMLALRHWRRRSEPTSRQPGTGVMKMVTPWWCAMGEPENVRSSYR